MKSPTAQDAFQTLQSLISYAGVTERWEHSLVPMLSSLLFLFFSEHLVWYMAAEQWLKTGKALEVGGKICCFWWGWWFLGLHAILVVPEGLCSVHFDLSKMVGTCALLYLQVAEADFRCQGLFLLDMSIYASDREWKQHNIMLRVVEL